MALFIGAVFLLAGGALAHNPAMTTHTPAPLEDGLLVAGGEGTVAFVDMEGQAAWQQNTTWLAPQAPVVASEIAAFPARSEDASEAALLGFDAQGPTWEVPLEGGYPWVAASQDAFFVVTTQGNVAVVDEAGELLVEDVLPFGARVAPAFVPGGGFVLAAPDGTVAIVDEEGSVVEEASVEGRPSSVVAQEDVIVVASFVPGGDARVSVFDAGLEETWSLSVDALRVGGSVAITDEGGLVFGTFDPDGAKVLAFTSNGEKAWSLVLEEQTAAAVAVRGEAVFASVNDGVVALDAASGERLWEIEEDPRVVSPSVVGGLVFPSGSANNVTALDAASGDVVWRWSDGVEEVPWYGHGAGGSGGPEEEEGEQEVPFPVGGLLVGFLVASGLARRARRP